jgi:hypothetical protein
MMENVGVRQGMSVKRTRVRAATCPLFGKQKRNFVFEGKCRRNVELQTPVTPWAVTAGGQHAIQEPLEEWAGIRRNRLPGLIAPALFARWPQGAKRSMIHPPTESSLRY